MGCIEGWGTKAARAVGPIVVTLAAVLLLTGVIFAADERPVEIAATSSVELSAPVTPFVFDGDWKRQWLSEASYRAGFADAEAEYTRMIRALIRTVGNESQ